VKIFSDKRFRVDLFKNNRPAEGAGYRWLIDTYELRVTPNWHESLVATGNVRHTSVASGRTTDAYPASSCPEPTLAGQVEFAIKNDGVNLEILSALFAAAPADPFAQYIASKPQGKYARRVWYLYERITGRRLPLADLDRGNYVDLLDPDEYVTAAPIASSRHRVRDNLLGNAAFCPTVRRTPRLDAFVRSDLSERCRQIVGSYPAATLRRALAYLYTKESKSSFEIEHIKPDAKRSERFVALLRHAEVEDFFNKPKLIELQNRIVDERFRDLDYREDQNYVGETVLSAGYERLHYISPRPRDLPALMDGMFASHARMVASPTDPVVHAAIVAYGFVFMHPFTDGNGRIHRFLIHNVLAVRGFTPRDVMFPVSATMLKRLADYDASLEAFSKPLMPLIDRDLDDRGKLTVHNDTARHYRFPDLTAQAEALFAFIRETVEVELVEGLRFLVNYDRTKAAMQEVVDMPDRLIDLFIKCCLQNHGRLSRRKREDLFPMLDDREVVELEAAFRSGYAVGDATP
jgi:hypothetical protein